MLIRKPLTRSHRGNVAVHEISVTISNWINRWTYGTMGQPRNIMPLLTLRRRTRRRRRSSRRRRKMRRRKSKIRRRRRR